MEKYKHTFEIHVGMGDTDVDVELTEKERNRLIQAAEEFEFDELEEEPGYKQLFKRIYKEAEQKIIQDLDETGEEYDPDEDFFSIDYGDFDNDEIIEDDEDSVMEWEDQLRKELNKQFKGKRLEGDYTYEYNPEEDDEYNYEDIEVEAIESRPYYDEDEEADENWEVGMNLTIFHLNGIIRDFEVNNYIYGDSGLGDYAPEDVFSEKEYFDNTIIIVKELLCK